jgi:hypothetical protein
MIGAMVIIPATGSFAVSVTGETDDMYLVSGQHSIVGVKKEFVELLTTEQKNKVLAEEWINYPAYASLKQAYEAEVCMYAHSGAIVWHFRN